MTQDNLYVLLLDSRSIQKYIFGSNKLKENIGASYLVSNLFGKELQEALNRILNIRHNLDEWKDYPSKLKIENDEITCEVGYIGGGNAMLLFKSEEEARLALKELSVRLLVNAPGLELGAAIEPVSLKDLKDEEMFPVTMKNIFTNMARNKSRYLSVTSLPKHGFTADCPRTGKSADVKMITPDNKRVYVSSESKAKVNHAEKAEKTINEQFADILGEQYTFTSEQSRLGQGQEDSHLAVVHIDGNGMSRRFKETSTLEERRRLSKGVADATFNAFRSLLSYIVEKQMPLLLDSNNSGYMDVYGFQIARERNKWLLPIRSLIIGGDDITFVSDGRLGIHYAEMFMRYFAEQQAVGFPLSSSAGVAIIKTKYPFYRGYELAEELCSIAKKRARNFNSLHKWQCSSWLDYFVAYGGISGGVEDMREKHFVVNGKPLNFSPYLVCGTDSNGNEVYDETSIDNLKKGIDYLNREWPNSKLKEFREAISVPGKSNKFLKDIQARGLKLPGSEEKMYQEPYYEYDRCWVKGRTPYFDMLELKEFYPDFCLENPHRGGNA